MKYTLKYMQMKTDLNGFNLYRLINILLSEGPKGRQAMPFFIKFDPFQGAVILTVNVVTISCHKL